MKRITEEEKMEVYAEEYAKRAMEEAEDPCYICCGGNRVTCQELTMYGLCSLDKEVRYDVV